MDIFSNSCNVAFLNYKLLCAKRTGYLSRIRFLKEAMQLRSANDFCISQWYSRKNFSCGKLDQNRLCEIALKFCISRVIQITWFLTELVKMIKIWRFGDQCRPILTTAKNEQTDRHTDGDTKTKDLLILAAHVE